MWNFNYFKLKNILLNILFLNHYGMYGNQVSNVLFSNRHSSCHIDVKILNCSPNKEDIPKYTRYRYAIFLSYISVANCDLNTSPLEEVIMDWMLLKNGKKIKQVLYKSKFFVKEGSLDYGIHKLKLKVNLIFKSSITRKKTFETECFFEIVEIGIQSLIYGGYTRSVNLQYDIYFQVITMLAPDRYTTSKNEVMYFWKCSDQSNSTDKPERFCQNIETSKTNMLIKGPLASSDYKPTPVDDLGTINSYQFSLFTGLRDSNTGQTKFQEQPESQTVRIVNRLGVNIGIVCLLSCGGHIFRSNPQSIIHLEAKFNKSILKTEELVFIWLYKLEQDEELKEVPEEAKSTDTSTEVTELRIKGNFLGEKSSYLFFVKSKFDGKIIQSAAIKVFTCSKPSGLNCSVDLDSNSIKGVNLYSIFCSAKNLGDPTSLLYEFYNKNYGNDIGRNLGFSIKGFLGDLIFTRKEIRVRATNMFGAYHEVTIEVHKNIYQEIASDKTTYSILAQEIEFAFGRQGRFLNSYKYRIALLSAYWDIISNSTLVSTQFKYDALHNLLEKLKSERIAISGAIMVSTVISNIVYTINYSDSKNFLTSGSVYMLAKVINTAATIILEFTKNPEKISRLITTHRLYNITNDILQCSNFVLERQKSYDVLQQHIRNNLKKSILEMISSLQNILESVLAQQLYALNDFSTSATSISLQVTRLKEEELFQNDEGNMKFLKLVPSAKIHVTKIYFKINPFWWSNGYKINTDVQIVVAPSKKDGTPVKLQLEKRIRCEMDVHDLNYITISGKVKQPVVNATSDINDKIIAVHRIESLIKSLSFIKFTYIGNDSSLRIVILEGLRPDYEYMNSKILQIVTTNTTVQFSMENSGDFFYIGILPGTNTNEIVEYNFTYVTAACRSWKYNTWAISNHCFIGKKSSADLLVCDCSLKNRVCGGQVYVPPHHFSPFDELNIFYSERDYPFIFEILMIIFAFYLILLMWAAKKDKKDELKMIVTILDDNVPYDSSVYLLGVYTGARIKAGTTSNIGFKLLGENGVSRAHVLSSVHYPILKFNSDNWFLFTAPKHLGSLREIILWTDYSGTNPNWYCSKIQVFDLQKYETDIFFVESWFGMTLKEFQLESLNECATFTETNRITRIMSENILYGFMESHYLSSVFFKHPRSRVTRKHRLSVVLLGVLVNALTCVLLFYPSSHQYVDLSSNLTIEDILNITLIGSLIEYVVSFVMMHFFKSCYSTENCPDYFCTSTEFHDIYHFQRKLTSLASEPKVFTVLRSFIWRHISSIKALPLQTVTNTMVGVTIKRTQIHFTYFFIILLMITCSSCIIIFCLRCGKTFTLTFLTCVLYSIFLTNIVIRPIKIIAMAITLGLVKIRYYELMTFSLDVRNMLYNLKQKYTKNYKRFLIKLRNLDIYQPQSDLTIQLQHKYQRFVVKVAICYTVGCICFLFAVIWIILLFKTYVYFLINKGALCRAFGSHEQCSNVYNYDLENVMDVWESFPTTIFPIVYTRRWYNRASTSLPTEIFPVTGWMKNSDARLIGVPRVRQIRVKPATMSHCQVPEVMRNISRICHDKLTKESEDTDDYGIRWSNDSNDWDTEVFDNSPWQYTKPSPNLGGYVQGASGSMYHSGGYIAILKHDLAQTRASLFALSDTNWIDGQTRAFITDFTVFNVNKRVYTVTYIITEVLPEGNVKVMYHFRSITLETFGIRGTLFGLMFIVFVLQLIYLMNISGLKQFFQTFWNLYDCLIVVVFVYTTVLVVGLINGLAEAKETLSEQGNDVYFSVEPVLDFSNNVKTMIGTLFSLMLFRLLRIIKFNEDVRLYAKDLLESRTEVFFGCLITVMLMFVQYRFIMFFVSTPIMYRLKDVLIFKSQFKKIIRDEFQTMTGKVLGYILNFTSQLGIFSLMLSQYHHFKKAQYNTRVKMLKKERTTGLLFGKRKTNLA